MQLLSTTHLEGAIQHEIKMTMKRYPRTNSRSHTFNKFKAQHVVNLQKRSYSHKFINRYTNKINFLDRSFELRYKLHQKLYKTLFVTRFSPSAKKAFYIIKKYWYSIQCLKQFKNIPLPPPMLAYKSNKNLKSFLYDPNCHHL